MKYLIAVKPCGCPSWDYCELHAHALGNWRHAVEHAGYVVCEADGVPEQRVIDGCPHGSLPAQLAAKVREMEAREAGLKGWLQTKIADRKKKASFYSDAEMGSLIYDLLLQVEAVTAAYEEVLTKLEGNGQWEGSKQ